MRSYSSAEACHRKEAIVASGLSTMDVIIICRGRSVDEDCGGPQKEVRVGERVRDSITFVVPFVEFLARMGLSRFPVHRSLFLLCWNFCGKLSLRASQPVMRWQIEAVVRVRCLNVTPIRAVFGKPESGSVCRLFAGSKGALQFNWNTNFNPQTTRKQGIYQTCKRPANSCAGVV
jgi:hypothetical protein